MSDVNREAPALQITWLQIDLIVQAMMEHVTPEGARQELWSHGIEVVES